jgi:hypothetical protein
MRQFIKGLGVIVIVLWCIAAFVTALTDFACLLLLATGTKPTPPNWNIIWGSQITLVPFVVWGIWKLGE